MPLTIPRNILFFLLAVILSLLVYLTDPFGTGEQSSRVIAMAVLMITLWVTEAMPMPVVALLPLILFPVFGISAIDATATSYSNKVIFLFMGGFMLGLAIEKWNLHRRIALNIVKRTGTSGNHVILGFIISTGIISMWLSNTATTMMMFPIALSVIRVMNDSHPQKEGLRNFSSALMIAIALSSNFGGIATIIGTPPNVAYAAYITEKTGQAVEFSRWILMCAPIALLLLASLYFVLVRWLYPNRMLADAATRDLIHREADALGRMTVPEKRVLTVFIITAGLWITRDLINQAGLVRLDDNMIAIMGATALFIVPAGKTTDGQTLLAWEDTRKMAWGILLLFGGGIALASALEQAGLIEQLGHWFAGFALNRLMLIFLVTLVAVFLSEVMSNVAQVIVFAPVVTGLADAAGMHPFILGIPMTLGASCASMLPMGTPPNAIAFSSGYIRLNQMMRAGFVMNIISILLITFCCWLILPLIFNTP